MYMTVHYNRMDAMITAAYCYQYLENVLCNFATLLVI